MNRVFRVGDRVFKVPQEIPETKIPAIMESISFFDAPTDQPEAAPEQVKPPVSQKQTRVDPDIPQSLSIEPSKEEVRLPINLGALSAKYESAKGGSSAIGEDSQGGVSYGKYQISEAQGTLKQFLRFLKDASPKVYKTLAPLENTAKETSGKFARAWKALAAQGKFGELEHEFIKNTHYDETLDRLKEKGIDLSGRPDIMKDVIWSTSVQHGGKGAAEIISSIPKIDSLSDSKLINRIYADRMKQFPNATEKERDAVVNRLQRERAEALYRLNKEQRQRKFLMSGEANGKNSRG